MAGEAMQGESLIGIEKSERLPPPRDSKIKLEYLKNGDIRIGAAASGCDAGFVIAMIMAATLIVLPLIEAVRLIHYWSNGVPWMDDGRQQSYPAAILMSIGVSLAGVFWSNHNFRAAHRGFMLVASREKLTRTIFGWKGTTTKIWRNSEIVWLRVVSQLESDGEFGTYYHYDIRMHTK